VTIADLRRVDGGARSQLAIAPSVAMNDAVPGCLGGSHRSGVPMPLRSSRRGYSLHRAAMDVAAGVAGVAATAREASV
jgi:hypothetical protein